MPGFLVTSGTTLRCAHGGHQLPEWAHREPGAGRLPVLNTALPMAIAHCAAPPTPAGVGARTVATWMTGATRVRAQGFSVVCSDSLSMAIPTGTPLTILPGKCA